MNTPRKKSRKIAIALLAAMMVIAVASCRSAKQIADSGRGGEETGATEEPAVRHEERLDTIQNAAYRYYSSNFSCEVDGISVNGQIRIVHDSAIWVSVNKIIEVGRLLLTPTRVQGYVKLANKYIDCDYATLTKLWGIDLDYGTIEALLTGNCPPGCRKSEEPQREGDRVTLYYRQESSGSQSRLLTIEKDYKSKKINKIDSRRLGDRQRIGCEYRERKNIGGQLMPSRVALRVKSSVYSGATELQMEKTTLNMRQALPFSIPKRYKPF